MFGFLQRLLASVFALAAVVFALLLVFLLEPASAGGWVVRIGLIVAAGFGALMIYRVLSPHRPDGHILPERHGAGIAMGVGVSGRRRRKEEDEDEDLELD